MTNHQTCKLSNEIFSFDKDKEIKKIADRMRNILSSKLHRRGFVIAMSGGIDSSVSAALSVEAVGKKKVFGILLPERDSSSESTKRAKILAEYLGIDYYIQDIAPTLDAIGCYSWRDEAIKNIFSEYNEKWKCKIAIKGNIEGKLNHFLLYVQSPDGHIYKERLRLKEYLQIVAATNYKQRVRKTIEYFHADRLNYAVVGTPNRLEYDQGFFVKNGDGSADIKPIAHLYKNQVFEVAKHLGLPNEVCSAEPTTDTYSMKQGQDEFYFSLPYKQMDVALWAYNHKIPVKELAEYLNINEIIAEGIYADIEAKQRTTIYQHAKPILIEPVNEIISLC